MTIFNIVASVVSILSAIISVAAIINDHMNKWSVAEPIYKFHQHTIYKNGKTNDNLSNFSNGDIVSDCYINVNGYFGSDYYKNIYLKLDVVACDSDKPNDKDLQMSLNNQFSEYTDNKICLSTQVPSCKIYIRHYRQLCKQYDSFINDKYQNQDKITACYPLLRFKFTYVGKKHVLPLKGHSPIYFDCSKADAVENKKSLNLTEQV